MANWCFCYCEVEGPEESRKKFFEELNDFILYMGSDELSNRALSTKIEEKDIGGSNDKVKEWKESHQLKIEGYLFYTEVMGNSRTASELKEYYDIIWDEQQSHKFKDLSSHLQRIKAFKNAG
jgi:predicted esterase YcpF (UPF0227 family)